MKMFTITFHDRFGSHSASKLGENPRDALDYLKRSHSGKRRRGAVTYDEPLLDAVQPFTEESRERSRLFWQQHGGPKPKTAEEIEVFFEPNEEAAIELTSDHSEE